MNETDFFVSEIPERSIYNFIGSIFGYSFRASVCSHRAISSCASAIWGAERLKRPQIRSIVIEQQSTRDYLVVMLGFVYLLGNFCTLFPFNFSHLLLNAISELPSAKSL